LLTRGENIISVWVCSSLKVLIGKRIIFAKYLYDFKGLVSRKFDMLSLVPLDSYKVSAPFYLIHFLKISVIFFLNFRETVPLNFEQLLAKIRV
jgi:hypothetical protein